MKKLIHYAALILVLFVAASVTPMVPVKGPVFVLNQEMPDYTFSDQFGESHRVDAKLERLIVALDKEAAHTINEFLENQIPSYLVDRKTSLIVDISAAPGIIQKMFILPGLKKHHYPVLVFRDKEEAAPFRMGVNPEKLLEVRLKNRKIVSLESFDADQNGAETLMKRN